MDVALGVLRFPENHVMFGSVILNQYKHSVIWPMTVPLRKSPYRDIHEAVSSSKGVVPMTRTVSLLSLAKKGATTIILCMIECVFGNGDDHPIQVWLVSVTVIPEATKASNELFVTEISKNVTWDIIPFPMSIMLPYNYTLYFPCH